MKFKRITRFTKSAFRDLDALHRQLSSTGRGITEKTLKGALRDKTVYVIGLFDRERIVGTATLTVSHSIGELGGEVDDVVLDEAYRGRGLGKKLMLSVIALAKKLKLERIDLTSRPSRIAANKLYQKLGFKRRDTNAYKMEF